MSQGRGLIPKKDIPAGAAFRTQDCDISVAGLLACMLQPNQLFRMKQLSTSNLLFSGVGRRNSFSFGEKGKKTPNKEKKEEKKEEESPTRFFSPHVSSFTLEMFSRCDEEVRQHYMMSKSVCESESE